VHRDEIFSTADDEAENKEQYLFDIFSDVGDVEPDKGEREEDM
jgi:hypothetical protein